jgi:hypothetical protein
MQHMASKRAQLKELNHNTKDLQVALNNASGSINRALQLLEQFYNQRRTAILSTDDDNHPPCDFQGNTLPLPYSGPPHDD